MREAIDGPSSSYLPPDQRSDLELDILKQVNAHMKEDVDILEEIDCYQSDEANMLNFLISISLLLMRVPPLVAPILHGQIGCHIFQ